MSVKEERIASPTTEWSDFLATLDPLKRLVVEETTIPQDRTSIIVANRDTAGLSAGYTRRGFLTTARDVVGGGVLGGIGGMFGGTHIVDEQPAMQAERRSSAQLFYRNDAMMPEIITFSDTPEHPRIQFLNWTGTIPLDEIYSYTQSYPDRTLIFTITDPETNTLLREITLDRHFSPQLQSDSYWIDPEQHALVFSITPGKKGLAKVAFDEFEGGKPVTSTSSFIETHRTVWQIPDAPSAIVRSESIVLLENVYAGISEIARIADVAGIHITLDISSSGRACTIRYQDTKTKMLEMAVSEGIFTNQTFENEGLVRSYFTIMQGIFTQMMPRADGTTAYLDPKYSEILHNFLSFHTHKRDNANAHAKTTTPQGSTHDYFPFQAVDLTTYEPGFSGNYPLRPYDNPQVDFASFATVLRFYPEALIERYKDQEKKEASTYKYSGPTFDFRQKTQNLLTFTTIVVGSAFNKYVRVNEALLTFFTSKSLLLLINEGMLPESYRNRLGLPKP